MQGDRNFTVLSKNKMNRKMGKECEQLLHILKIRMVLDVVKHTLHPGA